MTYQPSGQLPPGPFPIPGMPGGAPMGPFSPAPIGPTMPVSIFPNSGRRGDPITIAGPFGGLGPTGQLRVKFAGSRWQYPNIIGAAQASVRVPRDAETGRVYVEINGRTVSSPHFTIRGESPLKAKKRWKEPWAEHQEYIATSNYIPASEYVATEGVPLLGIPWSWAIMGIAGYILWYKYHKKG